MKYIYIVFGNRNIGSKHWYQDKIFIAKLSAENYRKKLLKNEKIDREHK